MKNMARLANFAEQPTRNPNVWEDRTAVSAVQQTFPGTEHLYEHQFGSDQDDAYVRFGSDAASGLLRMSYKEGNKTHPWADVRAEHGLLDLGEYILNVRERNRIVREQVAQEQAAATQKERMRLIAQQQARGAGAPGVP